MRSSKDEAFQELRKLVGPHMTADYQAVKAGSAFAQIMYLEPIAKPSVRRS